MKTILMKFIPGIALVAVALLAFNFGSARAENKSAAAGPVIVQQPQPMQQEAVQQRELGQAGEIRSPGENVRVIYVVVPDPIRWAAAYYGPGYCDTSSRWSDPFSEIRVNPIPYYPAAWSGPRFYGQNCAPRQFQGRR